MRRVMTMVAAQQSADASGNSAADWIAPLPGRMTISTPRNPTSTAAQSRMPTFSPRKTIDSGTPTIIHCPKPMVMSWFSAR